MNRTRHNRFRVLAGSLFLIVLPACRGASVPTVPRVTPAPDARDHVGMMGDFRNPDLVCAFTRLGMKWVRIEFRWDRIEPEPGVYDWSEPDSFVARARQLGFEPVVTLRGTPAWANGGLPETAPPRDPRDWVRFVEAVVRRYGNQGTFPDHVQYWLIWNEPNLVTYFTGTMDDYIDRILIPAARRIHELDPAARVGAPEMTHHWVRERYRFDLDKILDRALPYIDIVTHHTLAPPDEIAHTLDDVVYPILQAHNWVGRPFWITEVGWDTCDDKCGLDAQAHNYSWMLAYRQQRAAWMQVVIFFVMWTGQPCYHDILFDDFNCTNWHARPAYWTLLRFLDGQPFQDPYPECH